LRLNKEADQAEKENNMITLKVKGRIDPLAIEFLEIYLPEGTYIERDDYNETEDVSRVSFYGASITRIKRALSKRKIKIVKA